MVLLAGNCENSENENQMQTPQPAEKSTQKTLESQDEASHQSALCGHCSVECIRKIVLKGRLVGLQMMHTEKGARRPTAANKIVKCHKSLQLLSAHCRLSMALETRIPPLKMQSAL